MHTQHSEGIVRQTLRQRHIHTGSPATIREVWAPSCRPALLGCLWADPQHWVPEAGLEAQGKLAGMRSTVELLYRPLQGNRPTCFGCLVGPNQQLTGRSN